MKLLLDENISWRIIKYIEKYFDEVVHVSVINENRFSDLEIWGYAKDNNLTILTYDDDFRRLVSYYGYPPKIILLRSGNMSKNKLAEKIISNIESIRNFEVNDNYGILQIN